MTHPQRPFVPGALTGRDIGGRQSATASVHDWVTRRPSGQDPARHLIVYCHLRWDFVHQRPQHLLSRLAKHWEVIFIEEPVLDDGGAWLERTRPIPGVTVLKPHTSTAVPGFHDDQLSQLAPLIGNYLRDEGIDDFVAWLYTPMALPLLADLAPRAVVFDCMDELSFFKNAPKQLRQREAALMTVADLVLTGGPSLYEAKRHLNANVLCLPSAVDANHYAPAGARSRLDAVRAAERLQGHLASPRLGYFGVIDERLDVDLLASLAEADPDWQIVMVGPVVKIDPERLPRHDNITWLGQQPYDILPQLVAGWDVCLLPFALNDSTRYISPTKTLEYMAAEKPVVSTPVTDVVGLYGDVVRIGFDSRGFVQACRQSLAETQDDRARRIQAMNTRVALYSWDATAERIHSAIMSLLAESTLGPKRAHAAEPIAVARRLASASAASNVRK